MIIQPKTRGFICTTAHPAGCRENVRRQIDYVKSQPKTDGPKRVLVVGASTGYGLASRIAAAYSCGAATVGVMLEKPASGGRTATAGWYNTAAFEDFAISDGLYAASVNGDAFSPDVKRQTVELIKRDLGNVDLVVYSLAAPRRAVGGTVYSSVLKTTGEPYTNKTIDLRTNQVVPVTIDPATEEEIVATVKVMGGEDWKDWITALREADALADDVITVAYSYIGPELTHPIYLNGSIGRAKRHLFDTAGEITREFDGVTAYVAMNKALVTQSSAAIPVVPLYIAILYKVMKEKGVHEGCIEQMYRLFHEKMLTHPPVLDDEGRLRVDDQELRDDVQREVARIWETIDSENVRQVADLSGYWDDFFQMFGFSLDRVDYDADVDPNVAIRSIE